MTDEDPELQGNDGTPSSEDDGSPSLEKAESQSFEPTMDTDGGQMSSLSTHTIRLELVDEPGELLAALQPIADNGGNLLSIYHERGNITPRGRIPVEIDLEATDERFEIIVDALRDAGVNVIQAGTERYGEELTVVLVGHLIDTDLSDTLHRIEDCSAASVADVSLSAPEGTDKASSARLRLATRTGKLDQALDAVRSIADEKGFHVVEPLVGVEP